MINKLHVIGNGAIGSLLIANAIINNIKVDCEIRQTSKKTHSVFLMDGKEVELGERISHTHKINSATLVIVPIKAYQIEQALQQLSARTNEHTPYLLLHNGMGSTEVVSRLLVNNPVYIATSSHAAKKEGNDVFLTGSGETYFGAVTAKANSDNALTQQIGELLNVLIGPAHFTSDISAAQWNKLAINAVINPLTALYKIPNGGLANEQYSQQIELLIKQCVNVMQHSGIQTSFDQVNQNVYRVIRQTAKNYSSMYQDVALGRYTEIEAISGYIVEQGEKAGIDVSAHSQLFHQIMQKQSR